MKQLIVFIVLLCALGVTVAQTSFYMGHQSRLIKLGYAPEGKFTKYLVGDQRTLLAALYTLKSMVYYGDVIRQWRDGNRPAAEMENMFLFLRSSVYLDPYNMDTYYFAQAAFTWEVGHAADVNRLLDYGMGYRNWDWLLPYFAGFNAGYFLKDYSAASEYTRRAAELSGNQLLMSLAARYLHDAGTTAEAIMFLDAMLNSSKGRDKGFILSLQTRKAALEAMLEIEDAVKRYTLLDGKPPAHLDELVRHGTLASIPVDPYGGQFYIDAQGKIDSTSHLSFGHISKKTGHAHE